MYHLNNKIVLIGSMVMTLIMLIIVVVFASPLIDQHNGFSVIALQLSFEKQAGLNIINSWGASGIEHFKQWIFADYIYALSYSIFFASLLSFLILKKGVSNKFNYTWVMYVALFAGLMDWVENTLEIFFINSPQHFPDSLFFMHSVIAVLKWLAVAIVVTYIVVLLMKTSHVKDSANTVGEPIKNP